MTTARDQPHTGRIARGGQVRKAYVDCTQASRAGRFGELTSLLNDKQDWHCCRQLQGSEVRRAYLNCTGASRVLTKLHQLIAWCDVADNGSGDCTMAPACGPYLDYTKGCRLWK